MNSFEITRARRAGRTRLPGQWSAAALLLLLAAGAAQAQAQQAATRPEEPKPFPLVAPEDSTLLDRVVVTATRDERDLLDVPQTVDVITRDEIDRHTVRDVQDLVRYTPGVGVGRQTSATNPFSQLTSFQVRGVSGNRVQLLVDGSRVQEITTDGSRDFVDPFNLKSVEIVRGPNSVLWGSDALGGVVQFRTRDPEDLLADAGKPWAVDGDNTKTHYEGVNYTTRSDTGTTVTAINQGFNFPQVETDRADFYLQDEILLFNDRLTIIPGVRYSTYRIDPTADEDYVPLPGYEPRIIDQDKLTKKLGLVYDINDTYSIYASYGEGFKMPTSQQLFVSVNDPFSGTQVIPNPNLKPESVRSYEAGFRGEFDRGYFTIGGFYADYDDFIRGLQVINPAVPDVVTSDNVDDVRLYGFEFGGEYAIRDNFWINASISHQIGTQVIAVGAEKTPFDGAIPLAAVIGLRYLVVDWNLEMELIGTFASGVDRRSDPEAFKQDGYAVFDSFVKWNPSKNFELNAGIQNIFDVRYFPNSLTGYALTPASPAVANVNPLELQTAPGRTFKLGATLRF